ncbi:hypothetical protein TGMAS_413380 [Toxoplasma gondii MAS]|uniref:Uncharacterized protein n=1 Tax=Toxoplasma gondii MAS TaxID=943118 RepID=A0A086QV35_TOXGO|nr:hypothetical protein TGMAS_413380 [Toxoplasma gondii MAS]
MSLDVNRRVLGRNDSRHVPGRQQKSPRVDSGRRGRPDPAPPHLGPERRRQRREKSGEAPDQRLRAGGRKLEECGRQDTREDRASAEAKTARTGGRERRRKERRSQEGSGETKKKEAQGPRRQRTVRREQGGARRMRMNEARRRRERRGRRRSSNAGDEGGEYENNEKDQARRRMEGMRDGRERQLCREKDAGEREERAEG